MAKPVVAKQGSAGLIQIALVGAVVALVVLLAAALVRVPVHPPFYDTISANSAAQSEAP